ncbi:hypothetical protein GCM10009827_009020 [Dactylosporangium maewongense]|uniref:ROK family protein n=1 Tax=Dactylosporangium maewongense TaxID=634393 RepID=A0ABN1ZMC4_9ACTN
MGPVRETTDQPAVLRGNLSRTLRHIRASGPRSRAAIAAGLHKTTVSSLVEELLSRRLVRETGLERSGVAGRPARRVALSPELGAVRDRDQHGLPGGARLLPDRPDGSSSDGSASTRRVATSRPAWPIWPPLAPSRN